MGRVKLAGRRALSLGAMSDAPFEAPMPDVVCDWPALWAALGFGPEERSYLQANKLDRIPRRKMATHLGWTPARVEAVRVRVQRALRGTKLKTIEGFVTRGNSSRSLSYRETLTSGSCWSLTELGPGFAAVMAAERADWFGKTVTDAPRKFISRAA